MTAFLRHFPIWGALALSACDAGDSDRDRDAEQLTAMPSPDPTEPDATTSGSSGAPGNPDSSEGVVPPDSGPQQTVPPAVPVSPAEPASTPPSEPSPEPFMPKEALAYDEVSSTLGFSAEEASAVFVGEYSTVGHYADGEPVNVVIRIGEPTQQPITNYFGGGAVAAVTEAMNNDGEDALFFDVPVEIETEDGELNESTIMPLMAKSLTSALIYWLWPGNEIEGTHDVEVAPPSRPSQDVFNGTVYVEVVFDADESMVGEVWDTRLQTPFDGGTASGVFLSW